MNRPEAAERPAFTTSNEDFVLYGISQYLPHEAGDENEAFSRIQHDQTRGYTPLDPAKRYDGNHFSGTPRGFQRSIYSNEFNLHHEEYIRRQIYMAGPAHSYSSYAGNSYVAVDPFRPTIAQHVHSNGAISASAIGHESHPVSTGPFFAHPSRDVSIWSFIWSFMFDTIPRQIYLYFLLRLPSLYFSRVSRIFEEAELSMPQIKQMAIETTSQWKDSSRGIPAGWNFEPSIMTPAYSNLKGEWEIFIDSLMKEWKTLNIVSVLLLSAILTILQIESAAADPVTRYSALLSLICALMSLLYGCMYIIRFGTMRKTHKAAEWAEEAQKSKTYMWWNVWVLLSMPAVWLSWSIILYIICIMAFIWRTGTISNQNTPLLTAMDAFAPRTFISVVLGLGIIYFILIMLTFRRYGDAMDRAWHQRVIGWTQEKLTASYARTATPYSQRMEGEDEYPTNQRTSSSSSLPETTYHPFIRRSLHSHSGRGTSPIIHIQRPDSPRPELLFKAAKIGDLRFQASMGKQVPESLLAYGVKSQDWYTFFNELSMAWDGRLDSVQNPERFIDDIHGMEYRSPQVVVTRLIDWWNTHVFVPLQTQAILCQEYLVGYPDSPLYSVYLVQNPLRRQDIVKISERFGSVPDGLDRIDILDTEVNRGDGRRKSRKTSLFSRSNPQEVRVHFRRELLPGQEAEQESLDHKSVREDADLSGTGETGASASNAVGLVPSPPTSSNQRSSFEQETSEDKGS
ncbi:hypothetical protein BDQ12DRAFT_140222 [Crucibulum laeve]|uniref:Uncharacterized protein n=1 Tax=Crucibulum laeve TaxID=68775 RepID=A0A5C3M112_9AGAR|nr:hypothetical protein BDQ12DRAFT_140222 [Crucibulum laeve]